MDIETIRAKIRAKQYLVYDHAITEAFKDSLSLSVEALFKTAAQPMFPEFLMPYSSLVFQPLAT